MVCHPINLFCGRPFWLTMPSHSVLDLFVFDLHFKKQKIQNFPFYFFNQVAVGTTGGKSKGFKTKLTMEIHFERKSALFQVNFY